MRFPALRLFSVFHMLIELKCEKPLNIKKEDISVLDNV